ncbi:hypothetical protein OAP99_02615 [Flavobacteriaceae bacterium]|nr:hypothetical protein [Flavobacteriaceae bacterium]
MEEKFEILEKNVDATLELLQETMQQFINLQNSRIKDPEIQSLAFLDWLSIDQVSLWTGIKSKNHLRKLMDRCGVRTRAIQGLAQGPGMLLRYSREDIDNKIIVMLQDYVKIDLKKNY